MCLPSVLVTVAPRHTPGQSPTQGAQQPTQPGRLTTASCPGPCFLFAPRPISAANMYPLLEAFWLLLGLGSSWLWWVDPQGPKTLLGAGR